MKRREFLSALGWGSVAMISPPWAFARSSEHDRPDRLLILVELKGGNDGLNTIVPFADDQYYRLRPQLAIKADDLYKLDGSVGLNKALAPLMPIWESGQLAIVQGVSYPQPNLSHFRSIEIWDTASASHEYLPTGWLTRVFAAHPVPSGFTADAFVLGSEDLGPVAGGARAIELTRPEQFNRQAKLIQVQSRYAQGMLGHVLKVEADVMHAAQFLRQGRPLSTPFPDSGFGRTCKTACEALAASQGVSVLRLSLGSFDTHQNQTGTHTGLLKQLGEGLSALKTALMELGRWDDALILTYSEFGRRPKENKSGGTDHGTIAPHFVMGAKVQGGLYGQTPSLSRLDDNGNLPWQVDFRSVYATVLDRWWGISSAPILGGQFKTLEFV